MARHGFNHALQEQNVFHLCHIGDEDFLGAQIFHLFRVASVAVHDAPAVEVVERLQIVERAHTLYHLVATAERLHRVVAENERIEFAVDAVGVVALDKKHRLAAAQYFEVDALAQVYA